MATGMHWTLQDGFAFGKYNGFTVEDVLNSDPKYIDWCIRNFKYDTWDDEVIHLLGRKLDQFGG